MILNRQEFISHFNKILSEDIRDGDEYPLWIPETITGKKSQFFIGINPIRHTLDFWPWCNTNLQGKILCYSSSADIEWWGFTLEQDIPLFVLRWL